MMVEKRLPSRLAALETISRNLWWSWTQDARDLFESIDPALWNKVDRNPIALIDKLPIERINELEKDKQFLARLDNVAAQLEAYMTEKPDGKSAKIAYFSM